jgi:hypothetical protein
VVAVLLFEVADKDAAPLELGTKTVLEQAQRIKAVAAKKPKFRME